MPSSPVQTRPVTRHWFHDGITGIALILVAILISKTLLRGIPIFALFFFVVTAGAGWFYLKSSWRGLTGNREPTQKKNPG